jgi:hypothetical protein
MKNIIIGMALIVITAASCNNGSNTTSDKNTNTDSTSQVNNSSAKEPGSSTNTNTNVAGSIQEMVGQYLQMKNALANDNGKDAATAGNAFVESMGKMDKTNLPADKKKIWNDLSDDAKEMAEHIGKNAGDIAHQREHFDMLSKDMYDMVKAFGATQTLYNDYCPMYNNKKGAMWLSETKDIKNPYLGKKMPTCGEVKEEMKP